MRIVRVVLGSVVIVLLALSWVDPDLWGHVRFGQDIIASGQLTAQDPYSFTSDIPWVNHEWLSEVILAAAFDSGGNTGLILLKVSLVIATLILTMRGVWRSGRDATIQDALLAILIAGIWIRVYVIRPQLFSLVCFAALVSVLRDAEAGRIRRLVWLPVVFALWVNLHGGWIVGAGVLALWGVTTAFMAAPAFARPSGELRPGSVALAVAAAAAATLLNPYGTAMWGFLAETVRPERPWIDDWRPLYSTPALLPFWLPVAAAAAFGLWPTFAKAPEGKRARRALPLSHALIVAGLAIASVRVSRLDAFFAIATVTLVGPSIAAMRSIRSQPGAVARSSYVIPAVVAAGILVAAAVATPAFRCVSMEGLDWQPEPEAVPAIRAGALKGRMITWFGWGQYAIWHLSPDVKVSFDGRRETVYSEAFGNNHVRLYWTPEQTGEFLQRLDADAAWLPKELPLVRFLENAGWSRIFEGSRSVVLSRAVRDPLPQPAVVAGRRCFPGP